MKIQLKKTKAIIYGLLATLLLSSGSIMAQSPSKSELNTETRDKIEQMNKQFVEAMQKGDIGAVMELYADDATMMLPGGKSLKGKKEISDYLAGMKNIRNVKINVVDAGSGGKIMYQVGKTTFVTNVDGVEKEETRDFVMVLKRQSDWDYKIAVNSSN